MAVAHHLHLDVARVVDILLDQHAVVAERRLCLALGADDRRGQFAGGTHHAHAAPAAAGGRLHQHRKADLLRGARQRRLVLRLAMVAGHQRHAGLLHQRLGAGLRAHRLDHLGGRADEHETCIRAGLRELVALRQKAVARMDRLRAGLARGCKDPVDVEVAVARPRRSEQDRGIGHRHMQRIAIGFGIDGDRPQAERARRADDAAGDLAAVGDQQGAEAAVDWRAHHHILKMPNFVGSAGALAAAESARPSTWRVSAGSITPSSQSRAVA